MKHVRIAVFALAFTGFTDVAWGVTKQWTNAGGTGTGLWSDGANWNPAGAPSVGDVVEIGTAPTAGNCLLNVATSVAGVTIANPGTPPKLTVSGAITLSVGGPTNVAAGTTIAATNGATVALAGGGTISGTLSTLTAASKFDITGGILTLASGASVNGSGNFRIAAGHATVPASASITIPNLMMSSSGSTLSGSGTITLTGTITWDGGIIGSSSAIYQGGTVIVDSAAIMTLTGAAYYAYVYDNHTLINNGTINYQPPVPYNLYIQPNATLNNAGTFNYATALDIGGSATSAIVNSGLFQKTTAGAPKLYPPFLNNGGTLSAASGSFLLMNGGSASSGYTFTTGPGTSIEFSGGIYTLNNAGSFGGPGNFAINSGHLTAPAAVSVSIPNLTLGTSSSVLSGAGTFTLTGLSTWAGGNIGSTNPLYQGGTVIVGAGSTLNITHSNYYTTLVDTHTLTNNSVINYSSTGSFYLTVQNGATLNNAGVFDYQTDVDIQGSGTAQILNTGTFQKTAGTGLSLLYPRFDNTGGTVSANTGQLGFQGGGTASGAYTFNAGASASVDFRGTLYTLSSAGTFNGPGQFRIDGGHLTVPGAYR